MVVNATTFGCLGAGLLRKQLTSELRALDTQEENLIDLAADGTLPADSAALSVRPSRPRISCRPIRSHARRTGRETAESRRPGQPLSLVGDVAEEVFGQIDIKFTV